MKPLLRMWRCIVPAAASECRHPPLANLWQQALQTFNLPMEAVVTHMSAVTQLAAVSGTCSGWQTGLIADAERVLRAFVGGTANHTADGTGDTMGATPSTAGNAASEARAATAVFTVGEAAVLCGTKAPGSLVVLVQALTAQHLMPAAGAADAGAPDDGTPVPGPLQVPLLVLVTVARLSFTALPGRRPAQG